MSDLLIKGMEMPKDGVYWCEIGVAGDIATITIHGEERKSFPLVPVLEPHGRLIDADALINNAQYGIVHILAIENTPTVIEASKEQ